MPTATLFVFLAAERLWARGVSHPAWTAHATGMSPLGTAATAPSAAQVDTLVDAFGFVRGPERPKVEGVIDTSDTTRRLGLRAVWGFDTVLFETHVMASGFEGEDAIAFVDAVRLLLVTCEADVPSWLRM